MVSLYINLCKAVFFFRKLEIHSPNIIFFQRGTLNILGMFLKMFTNFLVLDFKNRKIKIAPESKQ